LSKVTTKSDYFSREAAKTQRVSYLSLLFDSHRQGTRGLELELIPERILIPLPLSRIFDCGIER
jgi:hypothetical protein